MILIFSAALKEEPFYHSTAGFPYFALLTLVAAASVVAPFEGLVLWGDWRNRHFFVCRAHDCASAQQIQEVCLVTSLFLESFDKLKKWRLFLFRWDASGSSSSLSGSNLPSHLTTSGSNPFRITHFLECSPISIISEKSTMPVDLLLLNFSCALHPEPRL